MQMASVFERIYPWLPVWGQNLAISMYGVAYRQERLGGRFRQYVSEFSERDRCTPEQMRAYVEGELRRTLLHAFDQAPYYAAKWAAAGIAREELPGITVDRLPLLPVTPKQDLRRDPESFVAADVRRWKRLHRYHTSGSTGTPVTTICTSEAHRRFLAARDVRSFGWAGATLLEPRAMIGGRMVVPSANSPAPYYRYNFAERQVYFSAYHISPDRVADYVRGFNRYRPRVLTGYAHCYYFLARMMLEQDLKLNYQPRCLVLSSEKTTPEMKAIIRQAFGARAFEEYGSVENCALATECESGNLHVHPDFGVVEIVDDDGAPLPPNREGRILCTGLLNDAQPLIRYEIGDIAAWSHEPCPCGRNQLPVLKRIEGRVEDAVVGPDGREMVRFHGLFIALPHVIEGQVIQESIDLLRVRVVATSNFGPEQQRAIEQRVQARLPGVRVVVERVPTIERTGAGKFRAVISRITLPRRVPSTAR